ncbi:hypothetical protein GYMLUDRAFT_396703 [Collybiopsis luxurians FD-317 M1]|uniref:Uncharacterized protein n=1 Tax=Collybiopsis luxurians FD-317 M1 TaxID=944289 RepID=A0A0D0C946_9AGAR|nr:hypothetical protein GYMLUDRAFT_396703 [Collybiopsis luxurians FD-317 M1]
MLESRPPILLNRIRFRRTVVSHLYKKATSSLFKGRQAGETESHSIFQPSYRVKTKTMTLIQSFPKTCMLLHGHL